MLHAKRWPMNRAIFWHVQHVRNKITDQDVAISVKVVSRRKSGKKQPKLLKLPKRPYFIGNSYSKPILCGNRGTKWGGRRCPFIISTSGSMTFGYPKWPKKPHFGYPKVILPGVEIINGHLLPPHFVPLLPHKIGLEYEFPPNKGLFGNFNNFGCFLPFFRRETTFTEMATSWLVILLQTCCTCQKMALFIGHLLACSTHL